MDINIRKAQPVDVQFAMPLIYSSGPHEFDYIFNLGNKTAQAYISFAFPTRLGVQSHRVFTVAESHGQVVGISAFYTDRDILRLNLGNFWNLLKFYGLRNLIKIAQRGMQMETIFPALDTNAGFISQVGVKDEFRGYGIGTALIQHLIERIQDLGLRRCVLDVAITNPRAQALYERLGFKIVQENPWKYPSSQIHVPGQRRMELVFS